MEKSTLVYLKRKSLTIVSIYTSFRATNGYYVLENEIERILAQSPHQIFNSWMEQLDGNRLVTRNSDCGAHGAHSVGGANFFSSIAKTQG